MIDRLFVHTCTITRAAVTVTTGVKCLFLESASGGSANILDGLLSERTSGARFRCFLPVGTDIRDHDQIAVNYSDGVADARRFTVQEVITLRAPRKALYMEAWVKVS